MTAQAWVVQGRYTGCAGPFLSAGNVALRYVQVPKIWQRKRFISYREALRRHSGVRPCSQLGGTVVVEASCCSLEVEVEGIARGSESHVLGEPLLALVRFQRIARLLNS